MCHVRWKRDDFAEQRTVSLDEFCHTAPIERCLYSEEPKIARLLRAEKAAKLVAELAGEVFRRPRLREFCFERVDVRLALPCTGPF